MIKRRNIMKNIHYLLIAGVIILGLSGCGDNKTKQKLYGTQVITATSAGAGNGNLSTADGMSKAVSLSANVGAMACGSISSGGMAPSKAGSRVPTVTGLTGPDADGYFSVPGYSFSNTTVKIRFQKADGSAILNYQSQDMQFLAKLHLKVTTAYSFGQFNGDFLITWSNLTTTNETMESGTITTADPVGGTFTAIITNMVVERTLVNAIPFGIPISGTMSISGTAGGHTYSGTNTYSKDGTTYKCEGPITVEGAKVADVFLTFYKTTGNYTGYWLDPQGAQHTIQ